jgi:1-deoxy-D-xylulose-5-phosphate reductoisomerase
LDLTKAFSLNFQPPDPQRFPALRIAYDVARARGTLGAVMNAANESAVAAFVEGKLSFGMISQVVQRTIDAHKLVSEPTLEDLLEADRWARVTADGFCEPRL